MRRKTAGRALVFDFDGTLIDATDNIVSSFNSVLRDNRLPEWTRSRILSLMGRPLTELFALACNGNGVQRERMRRQYLVRSRSPRAPRPRLLRGAKETVTSFSGRVPLAIATSRTSQSAGRILKTFGLGSHFSAIVGIDQVTQPKPHPESLWLATKLIGAAPEHSIFVGDTPDDMKAAREAGLTAVGVGTGFHSPRQLLEAGADRVISSLLELPRFIEE